MPCTEVCLLSLNPLSLRVLGWRGKKISTHLLPPGKKSLQCRVTVPGMNRHHDAVTIRKDFQGHSARVCSVWVNSQSPKPQHWLPGYRPQQTQHPIHPPSPCLPMGGMVTPLLMPVSTDSAFHGGTSVSHRSPTWSSGSQSAQSYFSYTLSAHSWGLRRSQQPGFASFAVCFPLEVSGVHRALVDHCSLAHFWSRFPPLLVKACLLPVLDPSKTQPS